MRAPLAFLAAAALSGCELLRDPLILAFDHDAVAVHAVLRSGVDTALVVLTIVKGNVGTPDETRSLPLTGADVRIVDGADTVRLPPLSGTDAHCFVPSYYSGNGAVDFEGCYRAQLPRGVRPGALYELMVDVPGRVPIRGRATVPHGPSWQAPEAQAELPASADLSPSPRSTLRWAGTHALEPLQVGVLADDDRCTTWMFHPAFAVIVGTANLPVVATDSVRVGFYAAGRDAAQQGRVPARLVLTQYDSVFVRYRAVFVRGGSISAADAAAGVTGAYGVFAAAWQEVRPVVLVLTGGTPGF